MDNFVEINFLELEETDAYNELIKKVVNECFYTEKLEKSNLYINIILTNPEKIRKINNEYRKVDKSTDVLSFPMFEKEEIQKMKYAKSQVEEVLGDVVISIEIVKNQAIEYGHSFERELAYMIVHGFYHLMGYDHIEEKEKTIMREKEENILGKLEILR